MKCVVDDGCNKILESIVVIDPNRIFKYGFSGIYSLCKKHVDWQITCFREYKKEEVDDNTKLSYDEKRNLNFEWKSRCSKCGIDLKGKPKWYFGFISESNGHRYATSVCDKCGKVVQMQLKLVETHVNGLRRLDEVFDNAK